MCAISAIGVIFLKRVRIVSKQAGIYLSKKITKFDFSADNFRVSIQLVTYGFHPKSCAFIYKIPARLTYTKMNSNEKERKNFIVFSSKSSLMFGMVLSKIRNTALPLPVWPFLNWIFRR